MIHKKQFYLLMFFIALLSNSANAQLTLGADAGISYNRLQFKSNNPDLKLSKKTGYMVNINIDQKLSPGFAVSVSPGLIQKNYSVMNKVNIYQNINNTYLQLPLSLKYEMELFRRLQLSGNLGLYYAYWLESNINGIAANVFNVSNNPEGEELINLESINSKYKFNSQQDQRSEFGWMAKIGLNYRLFKNISGMINGHFYQSMTDQQKQKNEILSAKYNQTFATTIGLAYHLK
ncbi:porin family protein [Pedobacter gandavensis]|uniref:porin family protein n=1 Tax=Pedobacter gandavensis TaxID=2679963 RepID=UPI0029315524|nr:porin family protein [Pedobacter gandavensis]